MGNGNTERIEISGDFIFLPEKRENKIKVCVCCTKWYEDVGSGVRKIFSVEMPLTLNAMRNESRKSMKAKKISINEILCINYQVGNYF